MLGLLLGAPLLLGHSLIACDNTAPTAQTGTRANAADKTDDAKAEEPNTLEARRYTHEALGFSIAYPEGWNVKKDFETFAFMGVSPQEGEDDLYGENVNIVAMSTPKDMSLEDFAKMQIHGARKGLVDYARRGASYETINGNRAARFDYVHTIQDIRIVSITFIQVKDNIGYAINCSATMDDYDRYRALLLQIARSFRFEE